MPNKLVSDLIIVAGHAPFKADVSNCPKDPSQDKHWELNPDFQLGEPPFYLQHIRKGLELVTANPSSLLLFSGGLTRPDTHWTEAETYLAIARSFDEFSDIDMWSRVSLEEYARDSFENLVFGLCRFHQFAAKLPESVSVISWGFKKDRFQFHADTIGWGNRFHFVGPNNPTDIDGANKGESKALRQFEDSPYGTDGTLREKRIARTFGSRNHGYENCSMLSELVGRLEDSVSI